MILLYNVALILLGAIHWLLQRRAGAWDRAYAKLAERAFALANKTAQKPGNGAKWDPCLVAKQHYELGRLTLQRDRAEAKHFRWQNWADPFKNAVATMRAWKGKKLPYTLGALDVWLVLSLLDRLGAGELVPARQVIETVAGWFTK